MRWLAIALVSTLGACSCESDPSCPAELAVGDRCKTEGQVCPFPKSLCGTLCECTSEPGAFRWQCKVEYCTCTCPCGLGLVDTCDAVECALAPASCPESAAPQCGLVCEGADAGPAKKDAEVDDGAALDARVDGSDAATADGASDAGLADGGDGGDAGDAGDSRDGRADGSPADAPVD